MNTELGIEVSRSGNAAILSLSGDLDMFTCLKLREAVVELINHGDYWVVIDMANVNYVDSSGLGTLIGGLRRVTENNGGLALSGATPHLRKVLSITGLSKILNLFDEQIEALQSLLPSGDCVTN